jgi:DNA-binding GntR family transcriptional regulator
MVATRQELFLPAGLLLRKRRAAELLEAHTQVFEAVRERDPEKAAERMSSHLAWTRTVVGTVLEEARAAANSHI